MKATAEMCEASFADLTLEQKRIFLCVMMELREAEKKHPKWPKDKIHAAAVVGEESGELLQAALQYKYEGKGYYNMQREAIQTAAMGIRFAINCPELKETKALSRPF